MKIQIESFLKPENLVGATMEKPALAVLKNIRLVPKEELAFESETDKYEVALLLNDENYTWLINTTSLKALKTAYGAESDKWLEKKIKLYVVDQNVAGKMKKVIYGMA